MNFPSRETVTRLRREYPTGCRVVLDDMDDPYTKIPIGAQATVTGVDDAGNILCAWDMGSSLSVAYGADRCHKVSTEAEAKATLDWYGKRQHVQDGLCPRCGERMPGSKARHAISRWADITVCDHCGTIEALEKAGLAPTLPMTQWAALKQAQNGGGKWNG